jgi:ribokinase
MGRVLVLGNAGLDLTLLMPRLPGRGETLLGNSPSRAPGGKGLNQAVAAVRTGAQTMFCAPVGADAQGEEIAVALAGESFAGLEMLRLPYATDFSLLMVLPDGENSIVSAGSCAVVFTPAMAETFAATAEPGDVLVLQGNFTAAATRAALIAASSRGATTLLNPAPLWWDVPPLLPFCSIVVVNRGEAEAITGHPEPEQAAAVLCENGASSAIVTLGAEGCLTYGNGEFSRYPSTPVDAVDTTGCGDTFCGVLAAMLATGQSRGAAVRLAQTAAALTATRFGAFAALPSRAEFAALRGYAGAY